MLLAHTLEHPQTGVHSHTHEGGNTGFVINLFSLSVSLTHIHTPNHSFTHSAERYKGVKVLTES